MNDPQATGFQRFGGLLYRYADWFMALGVLGLMVTLLTPIPPGALDVLVISAGAGFHEELIFRLCLFARPVRR